MFEAMMAANQSQNRIISDVLEGPVSNQAQRQLAQLQAFNGKNPILDDFEKGAREAAAQGEPASRGASSSAGLGRKAARAADSSADGRLAREAGSGDVAASGSSGGEAGEAAAESERSHLRRGAISLVAGPTILKGQGTGSVFNAARMAAYRQKYGDQLRRPLRRDPLPLASAERLSESPSLPPARPARPAAERAPSRPKGTIPAVAEELAKSGGGKSSEPGYDAVINKAAEALGLDPALIRAVVKTESNFNPRAVSSAGAKGLMQLMPPTAKEMGVKDPFDPLQNIWGGARYLKMMLDRHGGNLRKALASYNWGPGNVDRHGAGGALPSETRRYIEVVTSHYKRYKGQAASAEA
jgi:soluble lytic murein transglycosylase-like protein